jgi:undecaprenyl diphosphate synthase
MSDDKTLKIPDNVPAHVAIIMDGNGRWAKQHGLPRIEGHRAGADSVEVVLNASKKAGVKFLTLFAFSTENWVRPKDEVEGLMRLLVSFLARREKDLHKEKIRLRAIGKLWELPDYVQETLTSVMQNTASYVERQLVLALNYGGRSELVEATKKIASQVKAGAIAVDDINEETIQANLFAPDIPDPDLMIRTSGEMRLSNFLLWQLSYSELYVTDTFWPDFREEHFFQALEAYSKRKRRFGQIS